MHGIGNDYVILDAFADHSIADHADLPNVARRLNDRHCGIGGDGIITVEPVGEEIQKQWPDCFVRMRIFNADGSEAEMCGNGLRCVAKYIFEHELIPNAHTTNKTNILTGAGILEVTCERKDKTVTHVCVDMGEPNLDIHQMGVNIELLGIPDTADSSRNPVHRIRFTGPLGRRKADPPRELDAVLVSMGNPHAVFYHPDVSALELDHIGPMIEHHPAFTNRINVHFVQVINRNELIMRTWERGSGITLACGTGAAAVCVAGVLREKSNREVLIHLPGGDLILHWDPKDHHVQMKGSATEVFSGSWDGPIA